MLFRNTKHQSLSMEMMLSRVSTYKPIGSHIETIMVSTGLVSAPLTRELAYC